MYKSRSVRFGLIFAASLSALTMSACSTPGASRYGDGPSVTPPMPCGTVVVPCGQILEYHPVQVSPPLYLVPAPCPAGQCIPPVEPPIVEEPPVVEQVPYVPPPTVEPPAELLPPPPPPISCPQGSIPAYGGEDCIPIAVPRK